MAFKQLVEFLKETKEHFREFAQDAAMESVELGGYIDTETEIPEIHMTQRGTTGYIAALPTYRLEVDGKVTFHTHPIHLQQLNHQQNLRPTLEWDKVMCLPTFTDFVTHLDATLYYEEPFPEVILTRAGITVFQVSKHLLKYLQKRTPEKQDAIINEFIVFNIKNQMGNPKNNTLAKFQTELANIFSYTNKHGDEQYCGFKCEFILFDEDF